MRIDRELLSDTYTEHRERMVRWVSTRVDHATAEDVVQDGYLRAIMTDTYDGRDPLPWLWRIVRNVMRDNHRKYKPHLELQDHHAAYIPAPIIQDAMALVPKHQREAVEMHASGYRYHEIAAVQGVPLGTVCVRVKRGRDKLWPLIGPL